MQNYRNLALKANLKITQFNALPTAGISSECSVAIPPGMAFLPLPHGSPLNLWIVLTEKHSLCSVFFTLMYMKMIRKKKSSKPFANTPRHCLHDEQLMLSQFHFLLQHSCRSWIKRGSNQCGTHLDFTKALRICKAFPLMSQGYQALYYYESYCKGTQLHFGRNLGQHTAETT